MSQHRNAPIPEEQILDAAHDLLLAVGMRRMSMADIARRADVSRATLYRRWPNVQAVVGALITREFARLTPPFDRSGGNDRAAVVDAVVNTVQAIRAHPLTRKIIDVDPEFLLPYLVQRRGTSTTAQLDVLAAALRSAAGTIRRGNRRAQARAIWLAAWSFTLTAPVLADDAVSLRTLDRELRTMLDRYLAL